MWISDFSRVGNHHKSPSDDLYPQNTVPKCNESTTDDFLSSYSVLIQATRCQYPFQLRLTGASIAHSTKP